MKLRESEYVVLGTKSLRQRSAHSDAAEVRRSSEVSLTLLASRRGNITIEKKNK